MPADSTALTVDVLRSAAQVKVEATSLRGVAQELGMSPNGLRSFLLGGDPYPQTRQKLLAWYVRERESASYVVVTAQTADAALSLLVQHFPAAAQSSIKADIRTTVAQATRDARLPFPAWLKRAR